MTEQEDSQTEVRIIRVDNTVVKSVEQNGKGHVEINGEKVLPEVDNPSEKLQSIREGLKAGGYDYEEFVQDREKTGSRPEHGDRYVLSRVYSNGDVEDLNYSNEKEKLVEYLKQGLELEGGGE